MVALSLLASLVLMQGVPPTIDPLADLPIFAPEGAKVSFELDATDGDLLALLRGLLEPSLGARVSSVNLPFNIPMIGQSAVGELLDGGLARVLKGLRRVRVVNYDGANITPEPIFAAWRNEGARTMISVSEGGKGPVTVLRVPGGIATAFRSGGSVVAVRTVGIPDMYELGRVIRKTVFAALAPTPLPAPKARPAVKKG